jgi:hypothetical protein
MPLFYGRTGVQFPRAAAATAAGNIQQCWAVWQVRIIGKINMFTISNRIGNLVCFLELVPEIKKLN